MNNDTNSNPSEEIDDYITQQKMMYSAGVLYPIACALPKLAICVLYLRLFQIRKSIRYVTYGTIVFIIVNMIAWLVPSIVVCLPIHAFWSSSGGGRCINTNTLGTWISLPHIISDIVILIIPLPVIWRAQMSLGRKIGLFITFLSGSM